MIAKAIKINPDVVSRYLTLYYDSKYINRSRKRGVKGMVCSLTKKGYRMLGRYLERHMKGEHLNLKWKVYPVKEHDFYLLLRTEEVIKNELCTESIQ